METTDIDRKAFTVCLHRDKAARQTKQHLEESGSLYVFGAGALEVNKTLLNCSRLETAKIAIRRELKKYDFDTVNQYKLDLDSGLIPSALAWAWLSHDYSGSFMFGEEEHKLPSGIQAGSIMKHWDAVVLAVNILINNEEISLSGEEREGLSRCTIARAITLLKDTPREVALKVAKQLNI